MLLMKRIRGRVLIGFLIAVITVMMPLTSLGAETDGVNGTENTMELTLDKAADLALAHSNELKLAEYDIEQNEESRKDAAENVTFVPTSNASSQQSSAYLNLIQSDITLSVSKKSKDIKSDSVVLSVFQDYTTVLTNQEKVAVAEKALANADFERLAARVSYQLGKTSLKDKDLAESSYANKVAALNESRINLDKSYVELNKLIGLNSQDRLILKDEPKFVPLSIANLETEVERRLDINPSLWQSEQNIEKARMSLQLWNGSGSWQSAVIGVDKAEINASDSKEAARQLLYNTYYSICQQEEQHKNLEQSLEQAEDDLNVIQLKYQLGMVSKGDILVAELNAVNARLSLKTAVYQHELAKMNFDKPWA